MEHRKFNKTFYTIPSHSYQCNLGVAINWLLENDIQYTLLTEHGLAIEGEENVMAFVLRWT